MRVGRNVKACDCHGELVPGRFPKVRSTCIHANKVCYLRTLSNRIFSSKYRRKIYNEQEEGRS